MYSLRQTSKIVRSLSRCGLGITSRNTAVYRSTGFFHTSRHVTLLGGRRVEGAVVPSSFMVRPLSSSTHKRRNRKDLDGEESFWDIEPSLDDRSSASTTE